MHDCSVSLKKVLDLASNFVFLFTFSCSKIGKLTLARLLMVHNTLISYGCSDARTESHYEEILALYHGLMKMDPAHTCHYEDEHSLVLLEQVNLLSLGLSVWGCKRNALVNKM